MVSTISDNPTELFISWEAPSQNANFTAYSVYCNTSANQSYPEQVIGSNVPTIRSIVNGTTLDVTLTGLNPYTQYSCYVTANTSVGEGSPSTILTVQTAQSGNFIGRCSRIILKQTSNNNVFQHKILCLWHFSYTGQTNMRQHFH